MVHSNHISPPTTVKSRLGFILVLVLSTYTSILFAASGYCEHEPREFAPQNKVIFKGVELAVTERVEIDNDLVKLSLGGEDALVSRVSEGRRVALWYLSSAANSHKLELSQLKGLIAAGIASRDGELLDLAFDRVIDVGALCSGCEVEINRAQFWRQLSLDNDIEGQVFLLKALMRIDPLNLREGVILDRVCQAQGVVAASLSRNKSGDIVALEDSHFIDLCLGSLITGHLRDLFSGVYAGLSILELKKIQELMTLKRDSAPMRDFALRLSAIEDLNEALSSGDSLLFTQKLSRVKEVANSLALELNELSLRESFIERAIANRRFGDALLEFKFIDLKHRSPRTHTLLLRILQGITLNDWGLLSDLELNLLIRIYSQKDSEVRAALVGTYSRIACEFRDQGLFDSAIVLARQFKGLGGDLDQLTPGFGEHLVASYLAKRDLSGALALVGEFNLSLSFITRVRLSLAHYGIFSLITLSLAVIALSLLLLLVIAALYFRSRSTPACASKVEPQCIPKVKETEPRFSDEYISALAAFSLKPCVTKEEIKNAYRAAVKRCHPDLKLAKSGVLDNSEVATTHFIELKERYERLLKLHGVEGGGR